MSLKIYVEREVHYFIQCTQCERKDIKVDVSKDFAVHNFKDEGWVETELNILCPSCAASGKHFD